MSNSPDARDASSTLAPWDSHQAALTATPPLLRFSGADVTAWQNRARVQLRDILGLAQLPENPPEMRPRTLWQRQTELGTIEKIAFDVEPGQSALGYFCLPKNQSGALPVFICLQGHSTGMHVSIASNYDENGPMSPEGDRDFASECMRRGIAAFCLEQRSMGQRRENRVGKTDSASTCRQSAMNALMLGRTLLGERVYDVSRAIDYLQTREEVDTTRLGCMGNSGGGTTTLFAAAMDLRIRYALVSCAFSSFEHSIMHLEHCVCNYAPGLRKYFETADIAGLIAPRPLVIVAGQKDPIFPIAPAREQFARLHAIYTAAGAANLCQMVEGAEGHRFYAADAWPPMQRMMKD